MPVTEERKAQMKAYAAANKDKFKAYRAANKDKKAAYNKEYKKENKEKIAAQTKARYEANKARFEAYIKEYNKTEAGIKSKRMSNWRRRGVNNVTDELYDYFMSCDNCEVCKCEFTETINKCLDHDHDTGDFRYVLCRECNCNDNWKNKI